MNFALFNQRAINPAVVGMVLAVLSALVLFLYQGGLAEAQDPPTNNEATGKPTISGTLQASETLTVDTSEISDVDGIDNATFEYQWISNDGKTDTDIEAAASSTYIIKPWDLGKYIKVRVSFTDNAGNEETLTSAATTAVEASPNREATGSPRITGMAEVGQRLGIVRWGSLINISDGNGRRYAIDSYQWVRNDGTADSDIQDATGTSYTLTDADEGKAVKVRVSFTDDGANPETVDSRLTREVAARPTTSDLGAPTHLWSRSSRGDERGIELKWEAPEGTVTGYQILRNEHIAMADWWNPLPYGCTTFSTVHVVDTGSDATTYTDTDVGAGASYSYSVRAINSDGVGRRSNSSSIQYRPPGDPGAPQAPRNLNSTRVNDGVELTWDAPVGEVTGYQILRRLPEQCEFGFRVYAENTNSTDTNWVDRNVVPGTRYTYLVRAINDAGVGELPYSYPASLGPVQLVAGTEPNNSATGVPTITGTAQVGETLTADTSGIADADGLNGARFFYRWLSGQDTEIQGATGKTYTLATSDEGKTVTVRVSFTDDALNQETLTSAATAAVAAGTIPPWLKIRPLRSLLFPARPLT